MADTDQVLNLAAIIRKVDGNHSKGAAALAESILDHPGFRAVLAGEPAEPEGREPASVTGQPSDEEIMGLMPQQMHEALAAAVRAMAEQQGIDSTPAKGAMRIILNRHVVDLARAVLARWGHQPAPPADGEVAELVAWIRGMYWAHPDKERATRAAELLQRLSPPQPVPVSERLPGPEDMTDDGEVWIEDPGREYPLADAGDYDWEPHKWILRPIGKFDAQNGLRWLPAHALPLPEVGE